MIRFCAKTHAGKRREQNEDAMFADPRQGIFLVADGVGGRAAGEVASALTVETFQEASPRLADALGRYEESPDWSTRNDVLELLDEVCQQASARVYDHAQETDREGMTTTLVVALVRGGTAFLAHVGDSRAYLLRDGLIRQLTEDHSMVNELVRTGQMSYEDARRSRYRSVITRAIGLYPSVQADVMSIELLAGDRLLLNSDGLSDPVPLELIEEYGCTDDVDTATGHLIQAALDHGGPDNVTVVMVEPDATQQTESSRARAQVMSNLFLFEGLPFHARLRVSRICQEFFFEPGQVVVAEGSRGDSMYVIVQGELSVTHGGVELARLSAGEHFGELGLLKDQKRSASVTGAEYGSAIVIQRAQLQEFCQREPALGNQILWRMLHTLGQRLRESNRRAARIALERE